MLFFRYGAVGALLCASILLSGCGDTSWHDTMKSTRGLYYEYLNPPASIDYADTGDLGDAQTRLASNMRGIDQELTRFERYMINQDKPPTPDRVMDLFRNFRWVSGVVATSPEGEVLAQEPAAALKPLDYTIMATLAPAGSRGLHGDVQDNPLGPEVLLGVPVYASSDLKGYYVPHFDIRSLLAFSPDPASLVILSPKAVLWPGRFVVDQTPLMDKDWTSIVRGNIYGTVSNAQGTFHWICRYLGGLPIIFATPTKNSSFPENMEQLAVLDSIKSLGNSGNMPIGEQQVIETQGHSLLLSPAQPNTAESVQQSTITD